MPRCVGGEASIRGGGGGGRSAGRARWRLLDDRRRRPRGRAGSCRAAAGAVRHLSTRSGWPTNGAPCGSPLYRRVRIRRPRPGASASGVATAVFLAAAAAAAAAAFGMVPGRPRRFALPMAHPWSTRLVGSRFLPLAALRRRRLDEPSGLWRGRRPNRPWRPPPFGWVLPPRTRMNTSPPPGMLAACDTRWRPCPPTRWWSGSCGHHRRWLTRRLSDARTIAGWTLRSAGRDPLRPPPLRGQWCRPRSWTLPPMIVRVPRLMGMPLPPPALRG